MNYKDPLVLKSGPRFVIMEVFTDILIRLDCERVPNYSNDSKSKQFTVMKSADGRSSHHQYWLLFLDVYTNRLLFGISYTVDIMDILYVSILFSSIIMIKLDFPWIYSCGPSQKWFWLDSWLGSNWFVVNPTVLWEKPAVYHIAVRYLAANYYRVNLLFIPPKLAIRFLRKNQSLKFLYLIINMNVKQHRQVVLM